MAVIKDSKTKEIIIESDGLDVKQTVNKAFDEGMLLVNADLRGADLSNYDFSGRDFTGALLSCANFSNSILDGCNFNMANLAAANFSGASLCNARMLGARLSHAKFPDHAAMIIAGTGLPFFTCGTTIQVSGQEPMPIQNFLSLTEPEALSIGGVSLREALPKLKNAVSYFANVT